VRSLELTLAPDGRSLHPLVPLLTDSTVVDDAWMLVFDVAGGDTTTTLLRVRGDPEGFSDALADAPVVREFDLIGSTDEEFYAQIHTDTTDLERQLHHTLTEYRSILVPPIEYNDDGSLTLRVVGSAAELGAGFERVPDGVEATVERVGQFAEFGDDDLSLLTDRQREAVEAAVDLGYYDSPRRATGADIAERIGCTPSTASEHLRKAESRVLSAYVGG
jgi:predicted DNA binding protein